ASIADPRTFVIYVRSRGVAASEWRTDSSMHLTLLESHRSFFQVTECALASILAHAGVVWLAVGATAGATRIPTDEREARVFFLLPLDRVDVRSRQVET